MKKQWIAIVVATAALVTGCDQQAGGGITRLDGDDSQQVARVNGQVVTLEMLEAFASARGRNIDHPDDRRRAMGDLINLIASAEEAAAAGVMQDRKLAYELIIGQLTTISNSAIDIYMEQNPPTDEEIMAAYEEEVARAGGQEYHLLHLLYGDEQAAMAAQQALVEGAPFNDLVDELREAGVSSRVGDLGWVNLTQLPQPLAEKVASMQSGEMTNAPVKSDFGWHLVVVMNQRPLSPPPFESVADGIRATLTRGLAKEYVDQARAKAEVLIFD